MSYSAPHTRQSNQCLPTEPMSNTALVAEGGGQRGIFKHAVDLDWYFNQVDQAENKLNIGCGEERLTKRKLLFSATKADDRKATFFEPTRDNWLTVLKASSALPILYKKGVEIDNSYYVDGGLSAPIPVEEAYQRGAKRIVVIRTVPKGVAVQSPWAHKLKSLLCNANRCPKVLDLITHHENAYQATLHFIEKPPKDVEIVQIYPEKTLASRLVGSSDNSLNHDYDLGFQAGLVFLARYENNYAHK